MKTALKLVFATFVSLFFALQVQAVNYNVTMPAIFGSGNPPDGWAVNSAGGVSLGLRLKNRSTGDTTNTNGVYNYATPLDPNNANRAIFNWEFSVQSLQGNISATGYDFYVAFDTDNSAGTSLTFLNLSLIPDHSFGTFGVTTSATDTVGSIAGLGGANNWFQNSENDAFFAPGVINAANATRDYILLAVQQGVDPSLSPTSWLNSVQVTGVIGRGGESVSDTGNTVALLAISLIGMGLIHTASRRKTLEFAS